MTSTDNLCFHCHQPLSDKSYSVEFQNEQVDTCCPACQTVMQTILSMGLENYYLHRSDYPEKPEWVLDELLPKKTSSEKASVEEIEEIFEQPLSPDQPEESYTQTFVIPDIHCTACVWLIEHTLSQLPEIKTCNANFTSQRLTVTWNARLLSQEKLLKQLKKVGYRALPVGDTKLSDQQQQQNDQHLRRLIIAGLSTMQAMMLAVGLYMGLFSDINTDHRFFLRFISALIATLVIFYSGRVFFISAWRGIINKQLNMDFNVSLALLLAYSFSVYSTFTNGKEVYFDSVCMFIFFLSLGRYLEFRARAKTSIIIDNLNAQMPQTARKKQNNQQWQTIPVSQLKIDDQVRVLPGETVPIDGIIISGHSNINEALLTGESLPIMKQINDTVIGGSTNIDGSIDIRVTQNQTTGYLAQMQKLLNNASIYKTPLIEWTNKIARYFVLIVLSLAAITAYYWSIHAPEEALWIALSVLVVSCPCALSLAAPVAQTVATQALSKRGFLVRNAHVLFGLLYTRHMIFDKTGTLTQGKFTISLKQNFPPYDSTTVYQLAAALEQYSEHPIAHAFQPYYDASVISDHVELFTGQGIEAQLTLPSSLLSISSSNTSTKRYRIGHYAFIKEWLPDIENDFQYTADNANNNIYLADENGLIAIFEWQDPLREDAYQLIQSLKQRGITTHLLSGDPSDQPQKIATQLGIDHVRNHQTAEQKLAYLIALKTQCKNKQYIAMVGDGINDAPVLAGADIAIAIGEGTDLARISSDALLLNNQLVNLDLALSTAKQTQRTIYQNIGWAIIYNVTMLPLAMAGFIPPYIAAAGMSLSSLIVVINALRLKGKENEDQSDIDDDNKDKLN